MMQRAIPESHDGGGILPHEGARTSAGMETRLQLTTRLRSSDNFAHAIDGWIGSHSGAAVS